jgi:hypothetical protein
MISYENLITSGLPTLLSRLKDLVRREMNPANETDALEIKSDIALIEEEIRRRVDQVPIDEKRLGQDKGDSL